MTFLTLVAPAEKPTLPALIYEHNHIAAMHSIAARYASAVALEFPGYGEAAAKEHSYYQRLQALTEQIRNEVAQRLGIEPELAGGYLTLLGDIL